MASAQNAVKDWWDSFLRGAEAGVRETAQRILEESKPIISAEAIDRGGILQSTEDAGAVGRVSRFHYQARWSAEHAVFSNYGTGPQHYPDPRSNYRPPFEVILAWVKRNARLLSSIPVELSDDPELGDWGRMELSVRDGGDVVFKPKRKRGTRKLPDEHARRVARAVQASIYLKGTEPVLFAERAAQKVMPHFDAILEENIARELKAWELRHRRPQEGS